jgi:hypothetical protein
MIDDLLPTVACAALALAAIMIPRAVKMLDRPAPRTIGPCAKCARPILARDMYTARRPSSDADFEPGAQLLSHHRCPVRMPQ